MWSKDFTAAPDDGTQILVRHPEWQCPAVAYWSDETAEWLFAEDAIADIDGGAIDVSECEWTGIPT